jgi:glycosyltransferase involved in cell wall biosynthesis
MARFLDVGGNESHMKITVILCTYNRSQSLSKALESVASSKFPEPIEWEVLVVDNNSQDQTCNVIEDYCRRYPSRFRYLFEGRQGKSHALNAGVRAAKGEVLAFMDDDVTVDPMWLQNLTAALGNRKWAGAGGRTLPARPFSLPRWLTIEGPYEMGAILAALFDLGGKSIELDRPPYGANMAFHKEMFERHGFFDIDLGPRPGSEIRGEDTEFGRRLMAAGERLRYEPSAIVYHPVPDNRIQKAYLLAWWFDHGRAEIREKVWRSDILGIPRHYLSIAKTIGAHLSVRMLRWICALNPQARFFWKCQAWRMGGEIVETYRLARAVKRQENDAAQERETETG